MRKRIPVPGIRYRRAWKSSYKHRRAVKESLGFKRAKAKGLDSIKKEDRALGH